MAKLIDIDGLARFRDDLLGGRSLDMLTDGVFIHYYRKADNVSLLARLGEWASLRDSGETGIGVAVVGQGKILTVAPDYAVCIWATSAGDVGGLTTQDREEAFADMDGKGNTAAHLEYEACRGEDTANGYCAAYSSRANANGYTLGASNWWLPSVGELLMIYSRLETVMYAMTLIGGELPLRAFWASTQVSGSNAWRIDFSVGQAAVGSNKTTATNAVIPVTTFIN